MLTPRENAQAILDGKQPDYYGDIMDTLDMILDPVMAANSVPQDGLEHKDSWGVTYTWPLGAPGAHPSAHPDTLVIKDLETWDGTLDVPSLENLDWSDAVAAANASNRKERFVTVMSSGGLFERSHHLMGFQNALENYMLFPDEVGALLDIILKHKIEHIHLACQHLNPDLVWFHDDWGLKTNLFLPPQVWRDLIKPRHAQIVAAVHEHGAIYFHHADCFLQPIVTDMVEIGIDGWQGAVAQNDIVEIQRVTEHKLFIQGGIDSPKIDTEATTEDQIRAEVRRCMDTYCPGGRFFPGIPNGMLYDEKRFAIYKDEAEKYGRQWALEHPIA